MLDLARHIVEQKAGRFEPDKFEDQYETALVDLINQKRAGKPITPKERPRGENVVDLMDALRKSVGGGAAETEAPKKREEAAQGGARPEGNADADRRQEAGEGSRREKAVRQAAAEVGLAYSEHPVTPDDRYFVVRGWRRMRRNCRRHPFWFLPLAAALSFARSRWSGDRVALNASTRSRSSISPSLSGKLKPSSMRRLYSMTTR